MTPVFGHGRLRLYLLKLLDESPRHGYEIIQQLRERFAGLYAPSAGTVYPRLARLESEGLIKHETDGGRKVYQITEAGRTELAAKAAELDALESEIHASVRDLAEGIRDEVRESARTVREELEAEAEAAIRRQQEVADDAWQPSAGTAASSDPGGPGGPGRPDFPPFPIPLEPPISTPPPDSAEWTREQWRDWRRAQQENWRHWRRAQQENWRRSQQQWREREQQWRDWRQDSRGQRDQWKDWQRAWKEQWARQWKEQWDEQWREQRPAWGLFGQSPWNPESWTGVLSWLTAPPNQPEDAAPTADRDEPRVRDEPAQDRPDPEQPPQDRDESNGPPRGRGRSRPYDWDPRREWERFGPQLQELVGELRREGGALADAARRHGPLNPESLGHAESILHCALTDLRRLFEGEPRDHGPAAGGTEQDPDKL